MVQIAAPKQVTKTEPSGSPEEVPAPPVVQPPKPKALEGLPTPPPVQLPPLPGLKADDAGSDILWSKRADSPAEKTRDEYFKARTFIFGEVNQETEVAFVVRDKQSGAIGVLVAELKPHHITPPQGSHPLNPNFPDLVVRLGVREELLPKADATKREALLSRVKEALGPVAKEAGIAADTEVFLAENFSKDPNHAGIIVRQKGYFSVVGGGTMVPSSTKQSELQYEPIAVVRLYKEPGEYRVSPVAVPRVRFVSDSKSLREARKVEPKGYIADESGGALEFSAPGYKEIFMIPAVSSNIRFLGFEPAAAAKESEKGPTLPGRFQYQRSQRTYDVAGEVQFLPDGTPAGLTIEFPNGTKTYQLKSTFKPADPAENIPSPSDLPRRPNP